MPLSAIQYLSIVFVMVSTKIALTGIAISQQENQSVIVSIYVKFQQINRGPTTLYVSVKNEHQDC